MLTPVEHDAEVDRILKLNTIFGMKINELDLMKPRDVMMVGPHNAVLWRDGQIHEVKR